MTDPSELPTAMTDQPTVEALTVALAPLMRRARDLRRTMAANETAYKKEIESITMQHAAVQGAEQAKLDYLEREIERLGRMRLEYEGDRKSVILLHGQIGTRRQPTRVEIEDEGELIAALSKRGIAPPWNAGWLPPPKTISKAALLKLVEQHKTEFPGMRLVLGEEKFFCNTSVVDTGEVGG